MDNLTRKSLQGLLRQAKLLENSATRYSHMTCLWPQSWKSTELLSSHHCSMAVSPRLSTIITSGIWRSSLSEHSISSWVSNGRTKSPISKFLDQAKSTSIKVMLLKAQLCWAGHNIWIGDECIPKQQFFGELEQGKRKQDWPWNPYKETLKNSLKWCHIKPFELNLVAQIFPHWHALTCKASASLEIEQHAEQLAVCNCQHIAASALATSTVFQCHLPNLHQIKNKYNLPEG